MTPSGKYTLGHWPLHESLELLTAEVVRFTRELIQIDSTNTGNNDTIADGETRVCQLIASWLDEVELEWEIIESLPGRGSLVCRSHGTGEAEAVVIHAHVDVVPVASSHWSVPPFSGEIIEGMLYGRGAVDMKNMAAMMVAVMRHRARCNLRSQADIVWCFFADEEAGGLWGSHWLVDNRPDLFEGAGYALSEVGGYSVDIEGHRFYPLAMAEKGTAWATLSATGSAGHASMPTADNALATLCSAISKLSTHEFAVSPHDTTHALCAELSRVLGREITAAELASAPEFLGFFAKIVSASLRHTVTPTVMNAGVKTNVIPQSATAMVDCRTLPGGEKQLCELVEQLVGPDVEIQWQLQDGIEASQCALTDLITQVMKRHDPNGTVLPHTLPASTDNKALSRLGIAGFGFVPLQVPANFDVFGQFHNHDEKVPVSALEFGVKVLADIADGL